MPNMEPMETAPKDGTEVLLAWEDRWARRIDIGYYESSMIVPSGWRIPGIVRSVTPLYWAPLPEIPLNA